jgi:hypothetical protein
MPFRQPQAVIADIVNVARFIVCSAAKGGPIASVSSMGAGAGGLVSGPQQQTTYREFVEYESRRFVLSASSLKLQKNGTYSRASSGATLVPEEI